MMKVVLAAKHITKRFGDAEVLHGIDLTVHSGEFVAIMGRSGSGKSTLLYNISGMDQPTSGEVLLDGTDIASLNDEKMSEVRLHRIGFVFQQSYLLKNLSIRDNILLPGLKAKNLSRDEVVQRADEIMQRLDIAHIAAHDIKNVSGGQLQRASIARALINSPAVLIGDEPTGALNSSATKEVMDIFNSINEDGTTIVIVTHDAKVAARAQRVIYIKDGSIHDELVLGKIKSKDGNIGEREARLASWLHEHGF